MPARNTVFLSFALAWAETLGASDVFIGVNALDYSGYPDCRPEYIAAFEQMANLATKAGVEGRQRSADPHPADRADQGADHRARPGARRGLLADAQLLRPRSPTAAPAGPVTRACCASRGFAELGLEDPALAPAVPRQTAMTYRVKEIYYTLQGEGTHAGRAAVFCRFTSCNLWTGREKDRHRAVCQFCDTDFVGTDGPGGGRFATAAELAAAVSAAWDSQARTRERAFVVCTGGEPLLQLDEPAVDALHAAGFEVAVETNGTQAGPARPGLGVRQPEGRGAAEADQRRRAEAGLPAGGGGPGDVRGPGLPRLLLQPMDGPERDKNTRLAVEYCLAHPQWRLSLQTHKYLGIA